MIRGLLLGALCFVFIIGAQLLTPSGLGLLGHGEGGGLWLLISTWIVSNGLLISGGLCLLPRTRRRVPLLFSMAYPLLGLVVAAVGWFVMAGQVGVGYDAAELRYQERLFLLAGQALDAVEVPAVAFLWAGFGFIGAALAASCVRPPPDDSTRLDLMRWAPSAIGLLSVACAVVAVLYAAGRAVTTAPSLDSDIQPWSLTLVPLTSHFGRPFQVVLAVIALVAIVSFPSRKRTGEATESSLRRYAAARGVMGAATLGAVAALAVAGPLWIAATYQEVLAQSDLDEPRIWFSGYLFTTNGPWVELALTIGLILVGVAVVMCGTTLSRVRRYPLAGFLPSVLVIVAFGVAIPLRILADERVLAGAGGWCESMCTCRQVMVARALRRDPPRGESMDPCETYLSCPPRLGGLESDFLELPEISSDSCPELATEIAVTRDAILVDDMRVVDLREGHVDARNKRDGAVGYFINPLFDALSEAASNQKLIASRHKGVSFDGLALVTMDRSTRSRTIDEVLYTGSQAEFYEYRFLVRHPSPGDRVPYRVVPLSLPSSSFTADTAGRSKGSIALPSRSDVPRGCDDFFVSKGLPADGRCGGFHWTETCVGVFVEGDVSCAAPVVASVEHWTLTLGVGRLELVSPAGLSFTASSAVDLADSIRGLFRAAPGVRLLSIGREDDLPFVEELSARAALVTPELFAAAIVGLAPERGRPTSVFEGAASPR